MPSCRRVQSGQNYRVSLRIQVTLDFAQRLNCSFTILGSILISPNFKDVAGLEDVQLSLILSYIYEIYLQLFSRKPRPFRVNLQTKFTSKHPSNLANKIFYPRAAQAHNARSFIFLIFIRMFSARNVTRLPPTSTII